MKRSPTLSRNLLLSAGLVVVGVALGLYARAAANVPTGISFSGALKNNGVADTGTHTFVFTLVDGSGNALGCADTRSALMVTAGRFDVPNLFSACATLDALLGSQSTLAVKIAVDGQTLSPNQPLGTVPYSARADAESAGALPGQVVQTAERVLTTNFVGQSPNDQYNEASPTLTYSYTPKLPNSLLRITLAAHLGLSKNGTDPHLGGYVRILVGGSVVAEGNVFLGQAAALGLSYNAPFTVQGEYLVPGSTAPITFDVQIQQRDGTAVTLQSAAPAPAVTDRNPGNGYLRVTEIAQ